jgi:hypothetical protein
MDWDMDWVRDWDWATDMDTDMVMAATDDRFNERITGVVRSLTPRSTRRGN